MKFRWKLQSANQIAKSQANWQLSFFGQTIMIKQLTAAIFTHSTEQQQQNYAIFIQIHFSPKQ